MKTISWELPLKTVSEANSSEHWTKKSKRHNSQQWFIRMSFLGHVRDLQLPCKVTLTRLCPRLLDEDNLQTAFKYIRDELSECILPDKDRYYKNKAGIFVKLKGRADSDERITWCYKQEKSSYGGIRIEIGPIVT